jgi:predicted acyltransferase
VVWQVTSAVGLLVGYWLLMALIPFGGHPKGTWEEHANLALYIDQAILGRFRDGTTYTWILSSMGFAASVLLGVFGGHILRSSKSQGVKILMLVGAGLGCLALGWLWSYAFPIIKHIWSSSMVLWAAGWSYLLLAVFYGVIDVLGLRKWAFPFVVIGANAIFIYMATELLDFGANSDRLFAGMAHHLGLVGPFVLALGKFMFAWVILLYMYRNKTFIKV